MMHMISIIPAILTDSVELLQKQIAEAAKFASRVQVDFALAPFIEPTTTMMPRDISHVAHIPFLEAHVMAEMPEQYIEDIRRIGFDMMYIHAEATEHHEEVIRAIRMRGLKAGLVFNPETAWRKLKRGVIRSADVIMFMTVTPGRQGNAFQESVLDTIREFRQVLPDIQIAVDGGISMDTIGRVVEAGATLIACGSAVWKGAKGPENAFRSLERKARAAEALKEKT